MDNQNNAKKEDLQVDDYLVEIDYGRATVYKICEVTDTRYRVVGPFGDRFLVDKEHLTGVRHFGVFFPLKKGDINKLIEYCGLIELRDKVEDGRKKLETILGKAKYFLEDINDFESIDVEEEIRQKIRKSI